VTRSRSVFEQLPEPVAVDVLDAEPSPAPAAAG
jgi:hypothetical protein